MAVETKNNTAVLVLEDGSVFKGIGFGATGQKVGEICFNTSQTGYQEILTDPSYTGQIITFTFPHIGNVGTNADDLESTGLGAYGLITRAPVTNPSNYRNQRHLDAWLKANNMVGLSGVDTRALTRRIRDKGAPKGVISYTQAGDYDIRALAKMAADWQGLEGLDLAAQVTTAKPYAWTQGAWDMATGYGEQKKPRFSVVAIDYGAKQNILRQLAGAGCAVKVVSAQTPANDILKLKPDGIFLSNEPGDPAATGAYAIPIIQDLIAAGLPMFGICLGHQLIALAMGAKTTKMALGHRGANHPVKDLKTGRVEITSQNHGFVVREDTLPANVEITHTSLFDKTNEGLRVKDKPVFCVQYHPEASPGPHDAHYLFDRFIKLMEAA